MFYMKSVSACQNSERYLARRISLCRELTKIHEEVLRGRISDMLSYYKERTPKGEYVLVVEGAQEAEEKTITIDEAVAVAKQLIDSGIKTSEACKEAAKKTGFSKSEIYAAVNAEK